MTRINVIHPKDLTDKHLLAEYREITRIPNNLRKSLNRKSKPFSMEEIPNEYKLGKGHVKYFFDKLTFLKKRYKDIINEMENRGWNPQFRDTSVFDGFENKWYNDYQPTKKAIKINLERINERLGK